MGIINLTPDSFYEPSRYDLSILDSGADIIDIGACSTRPGSVPVDEGEEWRRLEPVIWDIARHHPDLTLSIDTFRPGIVERVHRYLPRFVVNDVSGASDPGMLPLVSALSLPYVAMHGWREHIGPGRRPGLRGNITEEVSAFFEDFALRLSEARVHEWYLDPGFGFGKTVRENLQLLEDLPRLKAFGRPLLVGISRKRMTFEPAGLSPSQALEETSRLHLQALKNGADILRVHDVGAASEVISRYRES